MSRILILVVAGLLLFGGTLAADQMLQNPDVEPENADDAAAQEEFIEATAPILQGGAPIIVFALIVGLLLAGVRAVGGA